jgi:flagellar protein FlbT
MTGRLKIHLKPNERIFINGGLVRVDRKVTLELVNEVAFLLEAHMIAQDQATTPLRQLYYIIQSILTSPRDGLLARQIYDQSHRMLIATIKDQAILEGLAAVRTAVESGRPFDGLKVLRGLFELETEDVAPVRAGRSG